MGIAVASSAKDPVILFTTPSPEDVKTDPNWQVEIFGTWTSFADTSSDHIEEKYCDPSQDSLQASVFVSSPFLPFSGQQLTWKYSEIF